MLYISSYQATKMHCLSKITQKNNHSNKQCNSILIQIVLKCRYCNYKNAVTNSCNKNDKNVSYKM